MNRLLLSAAIGIFFFAGQPALAQSFSDEQKNELETIIKDYIIAHPEVLIASLEAQRLAAEKQAYEETQVNVRKLSTELETSHVPFVGPENADVTVVEFFDYNCGYCKKAFEEVRSILEEDKNVKFYLIDMPILGPTSLEASKWAMAAIKQGKYFEFHKALMEHQGPKNDNVLEDKAKEVGLDVKQARKDKESEEVRNQLATNMSYAESLSITGTPGFIIGDELARGYISLDQMKELIKMARTGESAADTATE